MSSPSSLSSISSVSSSHAAPPLSHKRRASSPLSSPHHARGHGHDHDHDSDDGSVSSDTSGSVPGTPGGDNDAGADDTAEQVTVCRWDGCGRDLGNMDALVKHLHEDHIGTRKQTYACLWDDCTRRGSAHASGYALRAHMRSHTKEKPFYCSLPECDRSFTRSDALAKHMRTVHETEALRPSDPVPKSTAHAAAAHAHLLPALGPAARAADAVDADGFSADEARLGERELLRLLRQKEQWAQQEHDELRETLDVLEKRRRECWIKKELLLDRVLREELGDEADGVSLRIE